MRALQEPILVSLMCAGVFVAVERLNMALSSVIVLVLVFYRMITRINSMQSKYQSMVAEASALWSIVELIERARAEREDTGGRERPGLDRAVELDPLSALYAGNRGRVLTCSRRFAEAEESCRRGLALDPGQLLAQVELIYALTFQGRFEEAITMGRRAIDDHGPTKAPLHALALSLALAGERDEAWQLLDDGAGSGNGAYRSPLTRSLVHAVCSEMDPAIECAHRAIDEYEPLLWYLKVHPMFDALRDDPRYPELLQRMNLHDGSRQ